jgi:hypothetical protein
LFFLALLTGLALSGYAEKKTKFESSILLPTHRFKADGFCGTLTGSVGAGDFFKGLQRIETQQGVEFCKKSEIVRKFPEEIDFAFGRSIGNCPLSLPNSQTAESLNDFVKGLSVVEWIDGDASRTVRDLSITKTAPITRWFAEYETPTWGLRIQVPSKDVAIANALVVSLLSENGHKVMNFTFSL